MSRRQDLLAERRKDDLGQERINDIDLAVKQLTYQIKEIEDSADDELFFNRDEDFDWMRISAQTVSFYFCLLNAQSTYLLHFPVLQSHHPKILRAHVEEPVAPDYQQVILDERRGSSASNVGSRLRWPALGHDCR